jgi:transposase InsO family protein
MEDKEKFLEDYYYNMSNPAAYTTPAKLYDALKSNKEFKFSKQFIRKWLQKQDPYTLQRQVRRPTKIPNIRVSGLNTQWSMDLMDMQNLSKENDGIKYLLILIDTLSKYLRVVMLRQKSAKDILNAMKLIFKSGIKSSSIRSDRGGEFKNRLLQKFLKENGVRLFFANQSSKASIAERVIRTIRGRLYRYFQKNRTQRYIDILPDIVANYNSTSHRSLGGLAPKDLTSKKRSRCLGSTLSKKENTQQKG